MNETTKKRAQPKPRMMTVMVHCEWPTGGESIPIEIESDATDKQISAAASDAFFNVCNYGWEKQL